MNRAERKRRDEATWTPLAHSGNTTFAPERYVASVLTVQPGEPFEVDTRDAVKDVRANEDGSVTIVIVGRARYA